MRISKHRGKWAVRYRGRKYSTGVEAVEQKRNIAEWKAREIIQTIERATATGTVSEILQIYLDDLPNRVVPPSSIETAQYAAKNLSGFFGDLQPDEITREVCREYVNQQRESLKDGSIRRYMAVLRKALNWYDPENKAVLEVPRPGQPRTDWLTREEFSRLVEACDYPHTKLFCHLAICTLGRADAILGLRWDTHINFDDRKIWLGFKSGGKNRATSPMTETAYNQLRQAQEFGRGDYVIEWKGEPVRSITRSLRAAYKKAGIETNSPAHSLRRSGAIWCCHARVPMVEISRRLGHASTGVTEKHYAQFHPDYMDASTDALEI